MGEGVEEMQKADVYSFAIICQEIIYRNGVFWIENQKLHPAGWGGGGGGVWWKRDRKKGKMMNRWV